MKDSHEKNFSLLKHQKSILTTNLKNYNYDIKTELKVISKKGDIPNQEQFWAWMDSYWHKEETLIQMPCSIPIHNHSI